MNLIREKCSGTVDESGLHSLRMICSNRTEGEKNSFFWTLWKYVLQILVCPLCKSRRYQWHLKFLMRQVSHPLPICDAAGKGKSKKEIIWNRPEKVGSTWFTFTHDAFVSNEITNQVPGSWLWSLGTFLVNSHTLPLNALPLPHSSFESYG